MKGRIVGLALLATTLSLAIPHEGGALVELPGTCIAGTFTTFCQTQPTMDGTFRYAIINPGAEVQWSVGAFGSGNSDGAHWTTSPRSGTLTATNCPCRAYVSIPYPGPIVPNPLVYSFPIGIVTSRGA